MCIAFTLFFIDNKADLEGRIPEFLVQEPAADAGGLKRKSNSEVEVSSKRIRQQEEEGKMKKENREEKRAKKEALITAADKMANKIFHVAAECSNCKCLKEELSTKEEQVEDLMASVEAKKVVITRLRMELEESRDTLRGK